jgi:lactoylglutathione lyase
LKKGNIMHLKYTILYVDNVQETIEFFEKAFEVKRKMIHESGDYGELDTGSTILSFSSRTLMKQLGKSVGTPNPERPVFEIAFETENVRLSFERAKKAGAQVVQEVRDEAWGQTTSYVSDRNGFLIEICSPVSGAS